MKNYLKEERQQIILGMIQSNKKVTVAELSILFGTSEVTIRRDLQELALEGKLVRSHRGALAAVPAPPEPPVVHRMNLEYGVKEQIGKRAANLVLERDSVFIGSGSTTAFLARSMAVRDNLTVVTNSISIANELSIGSGDLTVVVTGGMLRKEEMSLLGHIAELSLPEMRIDKVFMGMQAISLEGGLTTDHLPEVMTTRKIIEMGEELIILADHTKLGKTAAAFIAAVDKMTILVTDSQSDAEFVRKCEKRGIQVIVAG
jgi:DeoR/GlpR family transcriptional regulator of sugar metabolism